MKLGGMQKMIRIIGGLLLLSLGITTIGNTGPDFPGVLFLDNPKDFFIAESMFSVMAGIGLPGTLWGIYDLGKDVTND